MNDGSCYFHTIVQSILFRPQQNGFDVFVHMIADARKRSVLPRLTHTHPRLTHTPSPRPPTTTHASSTPTHNHPRLMCRLDTLQALQTQLLGDSFLCRPIIAGLITDSLPCIFRAFDALSSNGHESTRVHQAVDALRLHGLGDMSSNPTRLLAMRHGCVVTQSFCAAFVVHLITALSEASACITEALQLGVGSLKDRGWEPSLIADCRMPLLEVFFLNFNDANAEDGILEWSWTDSAGTSLDAACKIMQSVVRAPQFVLPKGPRAVSRRGTFSLPMPSLAPPLLPLPPRFTLRHPSFPSVAVCGHHFGLRGSPTLWDGQARHTATIGCDASPSFESLCVESCDASHSGRGSPRARCPADVARHSSLR